MVRFGRSRNSQDRSWSASKTQAGRLIRLFGGAIDAMVRAREYDRDPFDVLDEEIGWDRLVASREEIAALGDLATQDPLSLATQRYAQLRRFAPAAVDEDAGAAVVTVTLTTRKNTAPTANTELFYVGKPGETATRGDDYTPPPGSVFGGLVHFATVQPLAFSPNAAGTAWVAAPSFTIGIIDDQEAERAETIVFEVDFGVDQSPVHTITIRDNDAVAPGRPTDLEAAAKSQTRIQLAWTAPADVGSFAIAGYTIEVSENAGATWNVLTGHTGSARTDYRHVGLSARDRRHYRVSAISAAGTSAPSNVASATTMAAGPAATNPALPPPQDVNATPILPGEIRLGWWRNPNEPSKGLVDLRHGAHVLIHRYSDFIREFPRHLNREPTVQRLVKFSLGCGRDVLLAVLFLFLNHGFSLSWLSAPLTK